MLLASIELDLAPKEAFDQFVSQLKDSLEKSSSIRLPLAGEQGGAIMDGSTEIGEVLEWAPPRMIRLAWRTGAGWNLEDRSEIRFDFEPLHSDDDGRTKITITIEGWGALVGGEGRALNEWFADEIASNMLGALSPHRFVNWLTDHRARKPEGAMARETYRDPLYHRPNFLAILDYLKLSKEDYLLEVGCGGGAFLFDAMQKSGCKAAAVDHSSDMVKVARELNSKAISEKRLEILEAEAETLPYEDDTFTCAVSTGVFAFIEEPLRVLSEIHRVLRKGGRLVLFTGSKELRGTPAAPEPIASQLHFYEDEELVELARKAGFEKARVERPSLERYAREAQVPKEALPLFSGPGGGGQFLLAWKP